MFVCFVADPELDGSQRIAVLQHKLTELRKTYNAVKVELAGIERRRKKLRRREREGENSQYRAHSSFEETKNVMFISTNDFSFFFFSSQGSQSGDATGLLLMESEQSPSAKHILICRNVY